MFRVQSDVNENQAWVQVLRVLRADLPREHAEHSLELAALRLSVDDEQRMALFTSALAVLTEPQPATGQRKRSICQLRMRATASLLWSYVPSYG